MIFGVFDGLHQGHVSFLNQAKALGHKLIVVVAKDESVMRLKKHSPKFMLPERMTALLNHDADHVVIPGDDAEGGWEVVLKHRPHIVALGYDQRAMAEYLLQSLQSFPFACEVVTLKPHEPEKFKSSILNEYLPASTVKRDSPPTPLAVSRGELPMKD